MISVPQKRKPASYGVKDRPRSQTPGEVYTSQSPVQNALGIESRNESQMPTPEKRRRGSALLDSASRLLEGGQTNELDLDQFVANAPAEKRAVIDSEISALPSPVTTNTGRIVGAKSSHSIGRRLSAVYEKQSSSFGQCNDCSSRGRNCSREPEDFVEPGSRESLAVPSPRSVNNPEQGAAESGGNSSKKRKTLQFSSESSEIANHSTHRDNETSRPDESSSSINASPDQEKGTRSRRRSKRRRKTGQIPDEIDSRPVNRGHEYSHFGMTGDSAVVGNQNNQNDDSRHRHRYDSLNFAGSKKVQIVYNHHYYYSQPPGSPAGRPP